VAIIVSTSEYFASHPKSCFAAQLDAISLAGSPGLRSTIEAGIGRPVIRLAALRISRTDRPFSDPRFTAKLALHPPDDSKPYNGLGQDPSHGYNLAHQYHPG